MRRFAGALVVLAGVVAAITMLGGSGASAAHTPPPGPTATADPARGHHSPDPTPVDTPADQTPVPVAPATATPASPPASTAPVPTGPAVGTEVTQPALLTVPAASVGPTPQSGSSDVTLVILAVIAALALTAVGAFVLAIAMQ